MTTPSRLPSIAERDLPTLIARMAPSLSPESYAFCVIDGDRMPDGLRVSALFHEDEGTTLVASLDEARRHGLRVVFEAARITLSVHSDLEAVGLIASVSAALARAGIPCNVMSAAYHDHLFVPVAHASAALKTLRSLSAAGPASAAEPSESVDP